MNNRQISKQAGVDQDVYTWNQIQLERFAELVRQDEREACAKLCESMGVHPALNVYNGGPEWYQRQKECAAAIRGRTE